MLAYLVRRLLLAASTVAAVSFGAFLAFGLSFDPSGPLAAAPGHQAHRERAFVQHHYHLNEPILSRYALWVKGLLEHGFGSTVSIDVGGDPPRLLSPGTPIGPRVRHAAGLSAELVGAALALVLAGSAVVGTISAQRRRFRLDLSSRALAYLGAAIPTFLMGDLLRRAIAPQGLGGEGSWFLLGPPAGGLVDWLRHMTLPVLTLALGLVGVYARYVRSSMLVALNQTYSTVARAKGLTERRVLVRHALRNSLIPVTAALSLELGGVIGASIAADGVFGAGGLASVFLDALGRGDPFMLTALVVMTASIVCLFAFVGDVLVGLLDPRVRVGSGIH
jgi:peptide/nickel transport system permease protein